MFEQFWEKFRGYVFLELLDDGVKFSETIARLKQALLNSLENTPDSVATKRKAKKSATPQSKAASDFHDDKARARKEMLETIDLIVTYICDALAAHCWDEDFLKVLGNPGKNDQPPFVLDEQYDLMPVLNVKRLFNALYHLERGFKHIESNACLETIRYLIAEKEGVTTEEKQGWGAWAFSLGISSVSFVYRNGKAALYSTLASSRVKPMLDDFHLACELILSIEPEFLKAFKPEWDWIGKHFDSQSVTNILNKVGMFLDKKNVSELLQKMFFLLGLLLKQLEVKGLKGVDYSLLNQLLIALGDMLDEKTQAIQSKFSDPEKVFSDFKEWLSTHDREAALKIEKIKKLAETDIRANFSKTETQVLSIKLGQALKRLKGNSFDFLHYIPILQHALGLMFEISNKISTLSSELQQAIRSVVDLFISEYVSKWVALVDKVECVTLSRDAWLTDSFIQWLKQYYDAGVVKVSSFVKLNPFDENVFKQERLTKANERLVLFGQNEHQVTNVLKPAFEAVQKSNAAGAYQVLQPLLEKYNPQFSNNLLNQCKKNEDNGLACYPLLDSENDSEDQLIHWLHAEFEHIKQAEKFTTASTKRLIQKLGGPEIQIVFDATPLTPPVQFKDLALASERKIKKYVENAPGSTLDKARKQIKRIRDHIEPFMNKEGKKDAALSLANSLLILDYLKSSFDVLENWSSDDKMYWYVPNTTYIPNATYTIKTLSFLDPWVRIIITLYGYYDAVLDEYNQAYQYGNDIYQTQKNYYQWPDNQDKDLTLIKHAFYALNLAPMVLQGLSEGQPDFISKVTKLKIMTEANQFAATIAPLNQHLNIQQAAIRYPVLAFDLMGVLGNHLLLNQGVIPKLTDAVKALSDAVYQTMMAQGLDSLNNNVFHALRRFGDQKEVEVTLEPGMLSLWLEMLTLDCMRSFLAPLTVPSKDYIRLCMNAESYHVRNTALLDSPPHNAYNNKRFNDDKVLEVQERMARERAVDRAMKAEFSRLQKSQKFKLKYAGKAYTDGLTQALRPEIQARTKGSGLIEDRVFNLFHETSEKLENFDLGQDKGSCRLDLMRESILALEYYLKPNYSDRHNLLFYLFENKKAHAKKWKKVTQLKALVDDNTQPVSARIHAIKKQMDKKKEDASEKSTWFLLEGLKQCLLWILRCLKHYVFKTEDVKALNNLNFAADFNNPEIAVYDRLYAADARRLDAICKQLRVLKKYLKLKPNKSASDRRSVLFETDTTRKNKQDWLDELYKIVNNSAKNPRDKVTELREVMNKPKFKNDMQAYSKFDSYLTFEAFKRGVLWLLSCVGLYRWALDKEYKALEHAGYKQTWYSNSPLIDMSLFSENNGPSTAPIDTAKSAASRLGLI
ncbi:MAG: hypothetical protein QNK11_00270 [Legionella sp.]|nr:hypothetical protein [Legionella sp.]